MSEMYLALQTAKLSNHRRAGNTMRRIASPDRREASLAFQWIQCQLQQIFRVLNDGQNVSEGTLCHHQGH